LCEDGGVGLGFQSDCGARVNVETLAEVVVVDVASCGREVNGHPPCGRCDICRRDRIRARFEIIDDRGGASGLEWIAVVSVRARQTQWRRSANRR